MYVFCMTLPYGMVVAVGGLIGYAKAGSLMSLLAGGGSGLCALLCGYRELRAYGDAKAGRKSQEYYRGVAFSSTSVAAAVASVLAFTMGKRYLASGKFMPGGLIASLSAANALFCAYRLYSPAPAPQKENK